MATSSDPTPPGRAEAIPELAAERVLFEDHHLLVVNKPAPLLTQAPPGVPNLEVLVKQYIKRKYGKPKGVYLGVPHRLDRPVSGVIVFARNTKAAQRVHDQFHTQRVQKKYWAILEGRPDPAEGIWEDWLRKIPDESRVVPAHEGEPGAKRAVLSYRVLRTAPAEGSLVELTPQTGRMHQLRVQSAWRGHPVRGDQQYAASLVFGPEAAEPRDRVIALHARRLIFRHPFRDQLVDCVAPLPDYWPTELTSDSVKISPAEPNRPW